MTASHRRGGVWKFLIPVFIVLALCAGLLTYMVSLIVYTGPAVQAGDYAGEYRELALDSIGRDPDSNFLDWAMYESLIGAADSAFDGVPQTLAVFDPDRTGADEAGAADDRGSPPSGEVAADIEAAEADILRRFADADGPDLLAAFEAMTADRGPPAREFGEIDALSAMSLSLEDMTPLRNLCRMAVHAGRESQRAGDADGAIDQLETLRALALIPGAQGTLIERLLAIAVEAMLHEEIRRLAADSTLVGPEELGRLGAIDTAPPRSTASVLEGERLWVLGTLRDTLGDTAVFPMSFSAQASGVNEYFDTLKRVVEGDQDAPAELAVIQTKLTTSWRYAPLGVLLPAIGRFMDAEQRAEHEREMTALVLEIERYRRATGGLPETLGDLPALGEIPDGFVYERTDDEPGYRVGHPDIPES